MGISPESKDIWNNLVIKGVIIELVCLKKMALIRSGPQALLVFSIDKRLKTPSLVIAK